MCPKCTNGDLADQIALLIAENKFLWERLSALELELATLKPHHINQTRSTQLNEQEIAETSSPFVTEQ